MRLKRYPITLLILFALMFVGCKSVPHVKNNDPVQLAMADYIQGKTVYDGGVYHIKDVGVKFDYLHAGVKDKGVYKVSCADFTQGRDRYDIDYYVINTAKGYRVVREILHKKNGATVDEVLWMKER